MGYDIYIANKDKSKVLKLPIIPAELPVLNYAIENESFKSYANGEYNFIKEQGLYYFTLESWLPVKKYSFAKSDVMAKDVLDLLDYAIVNKQYIQIVIIKSDGSTYVNNKFSIESLNYSVKRNGDFNYSLGVKQYRETTKEAYVQGWNLNSTGWWYCYDYENYKWYASEWKYIGDQWYYFNENGYALQSQWFLYKNKWYWFTDKCQMWNTEWLKIDGRWYYFYSDGSLAVNTYTPDGYRVDSTGALM
ncbi:cell wall-binding protein [Clostridium butyricum]|uniref:cell wall-binding protein n=1 Tax=Clostridium butyricum TaxID=1492 RepID=UPI002AB27518|nr:cell wall-binding protein [Clostridium butyricum]